MYFNSGPYFFTSALLIMVSSVVTGCDNPKQTSTSHEGGAQEEQHVKLPVVEVTVGMTTREAREKSPEVLGKLSPGTGFDTWQTAYLNTPVHFIYRDDVAGFTIERPHTFSISPYMNLDTNMILGTGKIQSVGVELEPLFEDDIDAAMALARQWCQFFAAKDLSKPNYTGLSIDANTNSNFEEFRQDVRTKGVGLCDWEKDSVIYSVGMERVERTTLDLDTQLETKVWVYKVAININHRSVFEPYNPEF